METDSARGAIQPGLKILARFENTGLGFSARSNGLKNPCNRYHFFQPGLKKEREHAYLLYFRTSVNLLTEIGVLRPGWNWPCNRNNISARWAERNFSPGWNSPCNHALNFIATRVDQLIAMIDFASLNFFPHQKQTIIELKLIFFYHLDSSRFFENFSLNILDIIRPKLIALARKKKKELENDGFHFLKFLTFKNRNLIKNSQDF